MRTRSVKPGFFKNPDMAECEPYTQLLFIGLLLLADRDGKLLDRPKQIKAEVFPYVQVEVDIMLNELQSKGFITRYVGADLKLVKVINFRKHQNPHPKENSNNYPEPTDIKSETGQQFKKTSSRVKVCASNALPSLPSLPSGTSVRAKKGVKFSGGGKEVDWSDLGSAKRAFEALALEGKK